MALGDQPATKSATSPSLDSPLKNLATHNIKDIKDALDNSRIGYDDDDRKPRLSALYALAKLQLLKIEIETVEVALIQDALLGAAERWCPAPAKDLTKEIHARGLIGGINKWVSVERLIVDESERLQDIADKASALRKKPVKKRKAAKELEVSHAKSTKKTRAAAKILKKGQDVQNDDTEEASAEIDLDDQINEFENNPSPEVMTFLLYMVHTHLEGGGSANLLPGCPIDVGPALGKIIEDIPTLTSGKQISELPKKQKEIVDWIGNTFGDLLTLASNDLVIPGLDQSITQFILTTPQSDLHGKFQEQLTAREGKSIVLFHGTPTSNLLSILHTTFRLSNYDNGVWTALEPTISNPYAFKRPSITYAKNIYRGCGTLLGLEVAGQKGALGISNDNVEVVHKPESIMVRYVFVIADSRRPRYGSLSNRKTLEPVMRKTFKHIEEAIQNQQSEQ